MLNLFTLATISVSVLGFLGGVGMLASYFSGSRNRVVGFFYGVGLVMVAAAAVGAVVLSVVGLASL